MTPAELKTLREACGLSLPQLAAIGGVQERTARYWESGKSNVPDDIAQYITQADSRLTAMAQQAVDQVASITAAQGQPPDSITLLRYRTEFDLYRHHPNFHPFPPATHAAMLHRVYTTLQQQGIPCRIIYLDHDAYRQWHTDQGLEDTEATRSAWAALQPLA